MKKFIFIPIFIVGMISGTLILNSNKIPDYSVNLIASPEDNGWIEKDIYELELMLDNADSKFILYIGNEVCGDCQDMRSNVMPKFFSEYPDAGVYHIDLYNYQTTQEIAKWNSVIGEKDKNGNGEKGKIRNFEFRFTPTIVTIVGDMAVNVFDGFGGGELYTSRYHRWDADASLVEEGRNTALSDLIDNFEEWK